MKQWKKLFQREERKECYRKPMQFLDEEYTHRTIYPPRKDLFTCFTNCPFGAVKVMILRQGPYYQSDQAHGLCFFVRKGVQIPRSLKNIYKELKSDMSTDAPFHGCLTGWTKQGVFLINTVMSVREGQAAPHKKKGWETFTDTVISALDEQERGIVFVLQGSRAQKRAELITGRQHHILMSTHPSPLSISKGFFGNRPFSTTSRYLEEMGRTPIDWRLSE